MAEIKVQIQVNLPDDWVEQIVNRLRNDPDAKWVEVTRCKDCKHKYIKDLVWNCPFGLPGGENFFCGYGSLERVERRTDNANVDT